MRSVTTQAAAWIVLWACAGAAWAGCECTAAQEKDGWCADCKVGFIAGVAFKNEKVHKALRGWPMTDAQAAGSPCAGCKEAFAKDGACEACHVQFVRKSMYASPAAAKLAAGWPIAQAAEHCEKTRAFAAGKPASELNKVIEWSDKNEVGFVAGRVFADQETFAAARNAYAIIAKAAKACEMCEGCALALVRDGACQDCGVQFKDGQMSKIAAKPAKP